MVVGEVRKIGRNLVETVTGNEKVAREDQWQRRQAGKKWKKGLLHKTIIQDLFIEYNIPN